MSKFIFITGGVLSSLGKGLTASSIGALLESMDYSVTFIKLDPYLNVDPGTMSPYQHGEVFVTSDGTETDLDLGHYERFTHAKLTKKNSVTAGKLYSQLLDKERRGEFLGKTIQTVPHFTNEIKEAIFNASEKGKITIVEIGGTVGDIEGQPFIEAVRQIINLDLKHKNSAFIHLTYIPYLNVSGEFKTKPTQHSNKELRSLGIQPNILICRAEKKFPEDIKKKISLFTNVEESSIISLPDVDIVYELPILLAKQSLHDVLCKQLGISVKETNLEKWDTICKTLRSLKETVNISIVGKYTELKDAYKSLIEALAHAQIPNKIKVKIDWINAEEINGKNIKEKLHKSDGILVPGGFGDRGIEGKILAVQYARENNIPFLGICLGMQVAVIEFARNILGIKDANSTEFDPLTKNPVVDILEAQKQMLYKGATMRLGEQSCDIVKGSKAFDIYNKEIIFERHRHRYEFNPKYIEQYTKNGFEVSGTHDKILPEIIEIKKHPFFIGCQYHPEFQSKPFEPHPLFVAFVKAAKKKIKKD